MISNVYGKSSDIVARTRAIARDVAAKHADDVDRQGRFPHEAFEALKKEKLLSSCVPKEYGGPGCNMQELVEQCAALAQGCASSGMILAMHHIQIACIARHGQGDAYFRKYLQECVEKQLLVASITSEVGVWGDTRSSICCVEREGDRFKLEKDATTVSYGVHADDLLVTARRQADSPPSDQVLVLLRKGDRTLDQTSTWDTLGMRGTCSPGFKMKASAPLEQILPGSYADASAQTMVSYSHILWSGVWLGIASEAVAKASAYVRAEARKKPGTVPQAAHRLAAVMVKLQQMRNNTGGQAAEFDAITQREDGMEELLTIGWALKMNNIKVGASELAPSVVHDALQIVGIQGYKNDGKYSVGRNYRDALSAALMISNERIFAKTASMLLVYKDD
ncbi:MAG: acyl-CoA dehydrogenase family protein [Polyangiaceae bacterium]